MAKNKYEPSDEMQAKIQRGKELTRDVQGLVRVLDLSGLGIDRGKDRWVTGTIIKRGEETYTLQETGGKTHNFYYGNLKQIEKADSATH